MVRREASDRLGRLDASKRRRRDEQQAADGAGAVDEGVCTASASGGGESVGVSLDFFADLDEWLDECDDALLLVLPAPLCSDGDKTESTGSASTLGIELLEPVPPAEAPSEPVSDGKPVLRTIRPAPSIPRPPLERPKPKSSTQRQKEELAYLRAKVKELEAKMGELRSNRSPDAAVRSPDSSHESGDLWRDIAERQREATRHAEGERDKLRAMLEGQLHLAQSLQELLRKPKVSWNGQSGRVQVILLTAWRNCIYWHQVWEHLQEQHWQRSKPLARTDDELFDELLGSIDTRRSLLDSVLDSNGIDRACRTANEVKLNFATNEGISVDSKHTKELPFDFQLASDALWRLLCQGKFPVHSYPTTVVKHSPDIILTRSVVSRPLLLAGPVTIYRAVKRFVGVDSVEILTEAAIVMSEVTIAEFPPLQVVNQGWGRVFPAVLRDGTVGTVMQGLVSSVLTILEPSAGQETPKSQQSAQRRHREITMLTELILAASREKQASTHRAVESMLLDASLELNASIKQVAK